MKLFGKLKRDVANASSKTEAKSMIAKAGVLLSDEELDKVSGGTGGLMMIVGDPECPNPDCPPGTIMNYYYEDGNLITYICPCCSQTITLFDQG